MTKKLTVGTESFDYSITGDENYGEPNTDWASAVTDAVAEFFGPGDIKTTETSLTNGTTADVTGLSFDTAFVQRIRVEGIITRKIIAPSTPATNVESFVIEGAYNGTEYNITVEFGGNDTFVELFMVGGQVRYTSESITDTDTMSIKFSAKTLIDETAI